MKLKKEPETLIKTISEMLHEYGLSSGDAAEGIEYILDSELWKRRDPSPGLLEAREYKFFPKFCEDNAPWGLRTSYATVIDVCKRDNRIYHKVVEAGKIEEQERDDKGRFKPAVYNVNDGNSTKGNSKAYGLSRLEKYRPDLYESVIENEMSVNEAMIEAGFRTKTHTVKEDADYVAKWIKRTFGKDQVEYIKSKL